MIKYRPDIDGLRAVAVIPVVLFHSGFTMFSGGFVGVDVFFVISGYLITKIIIGDIERQKYSVSGFYERRIRRIAPAYFAMVVVTLIAGLVFLLPDDLEELGSSTLWSSLMSSNVFFWIESKDYFDGAAELKPLLHTWSLSVEEQFYIFFPLVLLLVKRVGAWRFAPLLCMCGTLVSFGLSIYAVEYTPMAAFYLLPTRAWELMIGSLLAFELIRPLGRRLAGLETSVGLLLILAPVFLYDAHTLFPGQMALIPVVGAALVIHGGSKLTVTQPSSMVGGLLSSPPFVFFGLISYSLYLWHWPIIVFTRYYFIEMTTVRSAMTVITAIAVAVLSWRFIEQPTRRGWKGLGRRRLFTATALGIGCVATLGFAAAVTGGFPSRVPEGIRTMASKRTYQGPLRNCGSVFQSRLSIEQLCVRGAPDASPDFLVVGDSHANALAPAIFDSAKAVNRSGYQISDNGYRPLLGFLKFGEENKYRYMNELTSEFLGSRPEIKDVIVVVYWRQAALVDGYYDTAGDFIDGIAAVQQGFLALVKTYPNKRFLFTLSTADSELFGANPAARAAWFGRPFDPTVSLADFRRTTSGYNNAVATLKEQPNVQVLDISTRICDSVLCHGIIANTLAFTDSNHLSYAGATLFDPDFRKFLDRD